MKTNILFLSIAIILLMLPIPKMKAQTDMIPNIMSPDVANLGKYGTYPVSYYTGSIDISIPLYQIRFGNMEIPLVLSYDASGFIPNKDAGIAGQNWTLMAGGLITRTINGIPDEQEAMPSGLPYQTHGYWYGIKNKEAPKSGDYIKNLNCFNIDSKGNFSVNVPYEHTPDLFTFNFCGHSGQFMIGNDGKVKVIADRTYVVDLSGLTLQNHYSLVNASHIKITSDDGYEFTFGGSLNSMEINLTSFSYESGSEVFLPDRYGAVNSWHITKIKAPDGKEVNFIYEEQDIKEFLETILTSSQNRNYLKIMYFIQDRISGYLYTKAGTGDSEKVTPRKQMSFIKICYLKEINTPAEKITFDYSEKQYDFYGNLRVPYWRNNAAVDKKTKKLNKISVYNNLNTLINNISFDHQYIASFQESSCYRMFLKGLTINDQKYNFNYQNTDSLPEPLTSAIDFWGYYNGDTGSKSSLLPKVINDISRPFDVDVSFRKTNRIANNIGMLSQITYPTGGWTRFVFETHEHGTILKRTKTSGFNPDIVKESGYAGGVRIKQITNNTGEVTNFEYKNQEGSSSGILIDNNIYHGGLRYYFNDTHGDVVYYILSAENIISASSIQAPYIAYSQVKEISSSGGNGYADYYYTSHLTHPDTYTLGAGTYNIVSKDLTNASDFEAQMKRLLKYSSREGERGKLIRKVSYDSKNNPVREESFKYNEDPNRFNDAIYAYNQPFWIQRWGLYHSYATYYYPNWLTEKKVIDYAEGKAIEIVQNFTYDPKYKLLKETKSGTSTGDMMVAGFKYPFDYKGTMPYDDMVLKNVISPVVEKAQYKNASFLNKIVNQYAQWHSGFYAPVNEQMQNESGSLETRVTYSYDSKGNVREITKDNADKAVYLWGYNYQYPIAEIKGASYEEVKSQLGIDPETLAQSISPTMSYVDGLRAKLPKAMVTTYTYKPLVGMTSMTDPAGVRTTYEYDDFGRLQTAKDHNGNITGHYQYHYQGQ